MSAQTHFIVNGNWYSLHLNVSDIFHMCSCYMKYEEQGYMTKNKYTCDVQNCYSLNTQQFCSTYQRLCAQIMEFQDSHKKV
jgi:hypothetical protein